MRKLSLLLHESVTHVAGLPSKHGLKWKKQKGGREGLIGTTEYLNEERIARKRYQREINSKEIKRPVGRKGVRACH